MCFSQTFFNIEVLKKKISGFKCTPAQSNPIRCVIAKVHFNSNGRALSGVCKFEVVVCMQM